MAVLKGILLSMILLFQVPVQSAASVISQVILSQQSSTCLTSVDQTPITKDQLFTETIQQPPSATVQTVTTCNDPNIFPTDLPTYTNITSDAGLFYHVLNVSGFAQDITSPYSLQGQIFGPDNSKSSNSWNYCVNQCLDWCDRNASCHSFNVFTFEENDYPSKDRPCQITCQCRPVKRHYTTADYKVYDPFMGLNFPTLVWNSDTYCFNETCCWNPNVNAIDPCLWDAAKVPDFILAFYHNSSSPYEGRNIIKDIMLQHFGFTYDCEITEITSCPLSFPRPARANPDQITAYLAVITLRRHLMYMRGTYIYTGDVLKGLITVDASPIVSQFTGTGTKPIPTGPSAAVSNAMSIIAALVGIVASLATENLSAGLWVASELLSLGATIESIQDDYGPGPGPITDLPQLLDAARIGWRNFTEQAAINFTRNNTFAGLLLNNTIRGTALNLTDDIRWTNPSASEPGSRQLLRAWTISQVLQTLKVFVHWEEVNGVQAPNNYCSSQTSLNYPGEGCFNFQPDPVNGSIIYVHSFPVLYAITTNGSTPHLAREYDAITNLANWNITWEQIASSSSHCQLAAARKQPGIGFGDDPFPKLGLAAVANAIATDPSVTPASIPCFFNLPVCDSSYWRSPFTASRCYSEQACCIGHAHPPTDGDTSSFGRCVKYERGDVCFWNSWADADNFAFDDWCARKIGKQGLWGSPSRSKALGDPFVPPNCTPSPSLEWVGLIGE